MRLLTQDAPLESSAQPAEHGDLLIETLSAIREDMVNLEQRLSDEVAAVHPQQSISARNLLHYLALRSRDIRELQGHLAPLGLSSLGRAEAHAMSTLDDVVGMLCRLSGRPIAAPHDIRPPVTFAQGSALLERQTLNLFKTQPAGRGVRIMVTMPSSAATDYGLVRDLLAHGMDVMRINCAHDGPDAWKAMIAHLRRAEAELGVQGQVMMDIAGPKLRTGPIAPGPQVVKWRPERDALGRVVRPARIWLTSAQDPEIPPSHAEAVLRVQPTWLESIQAGDRITLRDARQSRRQLDVVEVSGPNRWVTSTQTTYVVPGTKLQRHSTSRNSNGSSSSNDTVIGPLPALEQSIIVRMGDTLVLTTPDIPGEPATLDEQGRQMTPAHIGCTTPSIFGDVRANERIWLDDGKIGGVIRRVTDGHIDVEITDVRARGVHLRADKGINVPDSTLRLPALTEQDIAYLPFVAAHADIVGFSFVHCAADVLQLQEQLARIYGHVDGQHLGIVVKIETRAAVESLPSILLAAMHNPACGVMIARGDLAVECGYERLAELQEEILCIAEAAHVPVIWATQVLENLAQEGIPSRAEISDAAMGERAECVMLNKGPYIVEAVRVLDDILRRMQDHQSKRSARLRPLRLARKVWLDEH